MFKQLECSSLPICLQQAVVQLADPPIEPCSQTICHHNSSNQANCHMGPELSVQTPAGRAESLWLSEELHYVQTQVMVGELANQPSVP